MKIASVPVEDGLVEHFIFFHLNKNQGYELLPVCDLSMFGIFFSVSVFSVHFICFCADEVVRVL